jgi:hypothetical protein
VEVLVVDELELLLEVVAGVPPVPPAPLLELELELELDVV